jgi:hypothetical protein
MARRANRNPSVVKDRFDAYSVNVRLRIAQSRWFKRATKRAVNLEGSYFCHSPGDTNVELMPVKQEHSLFLFLLYFFSVFLFYVTAK